MFVLQSPFPQFLGRDGKPLQSGYVYLGQPSTNPIAFPRYAFWDPELTQPAPQPLRTVNGFVYRDGTPANVYAEEDFSLLFLDAAGIQISYVESAAPFSGASSLSADLAAGAGAGLVGFDPSVHYPAGSLGANANWAINAQSHGAKADGITNNTAAVQEAINSLGAVGGLVHIKRGTKFDLAALVMPMRCNIDYWMDDDLSRPNPSTTLGTNERVMFMANANNDGAVNELRVTSAFHPGINIDVRRDVAGHDAHLGPGQVRIPTASAPARVSFNIFDQQVDTYRLIYEIFGGPYSNFSGITNHTWRRTVTLTGVGTTAWASLPAIGAVITGATSGAKGWFMSSAANTTTVLWLAGKFVVGEALTDDNETTAAAVTLVEFMTLPMQPMGQDLRKGNWSFGLPVGAGEELVNVGGRVALMPTRSAGQYRHKEILHPGLVVSDSIADVPTNGFAAVYDTTPAAAGRRWTMRKILAGVENAQDIAHIGAVRAFVQFANDAIKSDSSFNVTSVVRTGTGVYEVNIPAGVITRLDPCVTFGTDSPLSYACCDFGSSTLTKLVIKSYTTGTNTAANLLGRLSVTVCGGDV